MISKDEARLRAANALETLQFYTKNEYPVGTKVKVKIFSQFMELYVIHHPNPISLEYAETIIVSDNKDLIEFIPTSAVISKL